MRAAIAQVRNADPRAPLNRLEHWPRWRCKYCLREWHWPRRPKECGVCAWSRSKSDETVERFLSSLESEMRRCETCGNRKPPTAFRGPMSTVCKRCDSRVAVR